MPLHNKLLKLLTILNLILINLNITNLNLVNAINLNNTICSEAELLYSQYNILTGLQYYNDSNNSTTNTFCPTTNTNSNNKVTCCTGNWENLYTITWFKLTQGFNNKLINMYTNLKSGINEIQALSCPPSALQSTTLTLLNELVLNNKWIELISLNSNNTNNNECKLKIVQAISCPGVCEPINLPSKNLCYNYCINLLNGCLNDYIKLIKPWKLAINSLRSSIRILSTNKDPSTLCNNPLGAENLLNNLNNYREPLNWIENSCTNYKSNSNCFNGKNLSSYNKQVSKIDSSTNPEYPFNERNILINNNNRRDVEEFKTFLDSISDTLSLHWPKIEPTTNHTTNTKSSSKSSNHGNILQEQDSSYQEEAELGSGAGDSYYNNNQRKLNTNFYTSDEITDDEDLLNPNYYGASGFSSGHYDNNNDSNESNYESNSNSDINLNSNKQDNFNKSRTDTKNTDATTTSQKEPTNNNNKPSSSSNKFNFNYYLIIIIYFNY